MWVMVWATSNLRQLCKRVRRQKREGKRSSRAVKRSSLICMRGHVINKMIYNSLHVAPASILLQSRLFSHCRRAGGKRSDKLHQSHNFCWRLNFAVSLPSAFFAFFAAFPHSTRLSFFPLSLDIKLAFSHFKEASSAQRLEHGGADASRFTAFADIGPPAKLRRVLPRAP